MRKFLVFPDGSKYELTPISYDEFMIMDFFTGASDTYYKGFIKANGWHDLSDFYLTDNDYKIEIVTLNYQAKQSLTLPEKEHPKVILTEIAI